MWAKMVSDLHLSRDPALGLRAGLEQSLRAAVRSGQLRPGTRLPSSRVLAGDLGVARNTVADVYTQLVAEGYLIGARGSGTRVAAYADRSNAVRAETTTSPGAATARFDLRPGRPDLSSFPQAAWLRALRTVLVADVAPALGYGDPRGPLLARTALAGYLARVRGVLADPQLVVLCAGYRQAVALLARACSAEGRRTVAVESPGLPEVPEMFRRAGLAAVGLPVDDEGAQIGRLAATGADTIALTPAHQFPTGVPLSPARRAALVDWAHRADGIVLEDDYDGEFRYDRQPIGAVQGLAPGHVVYAGSASKTLAPGLRLGWLVVPPRLLEPIVEEKRLADRHSSTLDHLALAHLISSGDYDRHIRRMRASYRRRRDELGAALTPVRPRLGASGFRAGLHVLVPLASPATETEVLSHLERHEIITNGLSRYAPGDQRAGLVVGYATPPQHLWRPALAAFANALHDGS
jgi:GntR family transcriptional regulator/MocR family aminotransferase